MEKPIFKNRENQRYLIENKEYWHSRSVAINVTIFVKYNYKLYLLIGKRGEGTPDFQGYWNIPCGYLDWDENGTEAAYREVWEECGLDLKKLIDSSIEFKHNMDEPWKVITDPISNKQNVSLRYGTFLATNELPILTYENSEDGEVSELEWMQINSLSDLDKKEWAFNHKELITEYYNKLNIKTLKNG